MFWAGASFHIPDAAAPPESQSQMFGGSGTGSISSWTQLLLSSGVTLSGNWKGQGLSLLGASMKQMHQQDPKTLVFVIFSLISILEPQLLCLGCSIHHEHRKHLDVAAVAVISDRP